MASGTVTINGLTVPVLRGRSKKAKKIVRKHLSSVVKAVHRHLNSRFKER